MKSTLTYLGLFLILSSCQHINHDENFSELIVCNQTWMLKNLEVENFSNGDYIIEAKTNEEWVSAFQSGTPAWCYYNGDDKLGAIHGKIYNWHAVTDSRGLAPSGWRIASDKDWTELSNCLGGQKNFLENLTMLIDDSTTFSKNDFLNMGGMRAGHGDFQKLNTYGLYFTNSEVFESENHAWRRSISIYDLHLLSFPVNKEDGLYVKCVKIN